jgi:hypothetical protein
LLALLVLLLPLLLLPLLDGLGAATAAAAGTAAAASDVPLLLGEPAGAADAFGVSVVEWPLSCAAAVK